MIQDLTIHRLLLGGGQLFLRVGQLCGQFISLRAKCGQVATCDLQRFPQVSNGGLLRRGLLGEFGLR